MSSGQVRAAGGVPWRVDPDRGLEVLLVHRPRYDDWSFPKGKRDGRETDEQCALREVLEETGFHAVLGRELPHCEYIDGRGRYKVVRYWEMTVTDGTFTPNDEVDEVRWVSVPEAEALLSYERDKRILERFAVFAGASS
jgi:8-oxo-dGTP pyrophosphatase MutT (NUDIX family)